MPLFAVRVCNAVRRRFWLWLVALVLWPVLLYANTLFAEYGFRDDYSILREAHEEPGKAERFCASHARPVYGVLLEGSFRLLGGIPSLAWGRLAAALLIGATAAGTAYALSRLLEWTPVAAVFTAALLIALPSAQVIVSWSICWPHAFAAALGIGAFIAAEVAFRETGAPRRALLLAAALLLFVTSTLTYQSNSLLYVVMIAAGLVAPVARPWSARLRWGLAHLIIVSASLVIAYGVVQGLFHAGSYASSTRVAFESDWLGKIRWAFQEPVPNAFALFALDDDYDRTAFTHRLALTVTGVLILIGAAREARVRGWGAAFGWLGSLAVLATAAFSISLIAAERWAPYRTLYALSGVFLVFAVRAGVDLANTLARPRGWASPVVLGSVVLVTAWVARGHAYRLIAAPQMEELRLVQEAAEKIPPGQAWNVFILRPSMSEKLSPLTCADEFGSLSGDSDWTPREMLKQVLKARWSTQHYVKRQLTVADGWSVPGKVRWNTVIDLRRLALGQAR